MMQISPFGLDAIIAFEGYFAKPYRCPAGVLTQGYGHTDMAGGEPLGGTWSKDKARSVLRDDLSRKYEPGVRNLLTREPTQGQYDAMVSFAFNCGLEALRKSSILKFHNRGEFQQASGAFALWVKAGGKTLPGLVRRRATEALMYAGVHDANFDGKRQSSEPIYGEMAQQVDRAREKVAGSGTIRGAGTAAGGGAVVIGQQINDAVDQLQQAEGHISAGTWIGMAIGSLILAGAAYAVFLRWDDAGRPLPWKGREQ